MKNQVIEVLNKEHGKKVIEYWKSRGVDTLKKTGSCNKRQGGGYRFYGVIKGVFYNYNENSVREHGAEIITLPEEKTFPREMLVSNNGDNYFQRIVLTKLPGGKIRSYLTVENVSTERFNKGEDYGVILYKYAKEISEVEEMTLEQVCEELGREIKIVK